MHYLLALTESLHVAPKLQSTLNAMSRCKAKNNFRALKKCWLPFTKNLWSVYRWISHWPEYWTPLVTDTLKVKYATIVACDAEVSQNIRTYLRATGGNFCFQN